MGHFGGVGVRSGGGVGLTLCPTAGVVNAGADEARWVLMLFGAWLSFGLVQILPLPGGLVGVVSPEVLNLRAPLDALGDTPRSDWRAEYGRVGRAYAIANLDRAAILARFERVLVS